MPDSYASSRFSLSTFSIRPSRTRLRQLPLFLRALLPGLPSFSPRLSVCCSCPRATDQNSNASRIMGRFRVETPSGSSSSAGYCPGGRLIILAIENATCAGTRRSKAPVTLRRLRLRPIAEPAKSENFSVHKI